MFQFLSLEKKYYLDLEVVLQEFYFPMYNDKNIDFEAVEFIFKYWEGFLYLSSTMLMEIMASIESGSQSFASLIMKHVSVRRNQFSLRLSRNAY